MKKIIILLIIVASLPITGVAQDPGKDSGVRIEIDTSFGYPDGRSEAIVEYLQKKYIDDQTFVDNLNKKYHLGITSKYSDEDFTDVYFDTPNLDLMDRDAELRHRTRKLTGETEPQKSLIQLKIGGKDKLADQNNKNSRNEIKFAVKSGSAINGWDKPLNFITKKEDMDFINQLSELKIGAANLKPLFRLTQRRQRIGFPLPDGQNFISFSVDDVQVKRWWWTINFSQLEVELNEVTYTNASPAMRKEMEKISNEMIDDLRKQFGELNPDIRTKVERSFSMLKEKIPFYAFWIKIGVL